MLAAGFRGRGSAGAPEAGCARPARTCAAPHGYAVAVRTRAAFVYGRTVRYPQGQGSSTAWTACWRRSGRRTKLAETGENPWSDSATSGPLRLAGRFLAFPVTYTDRYNESSLAVTVYDLARGSRYYALHYWNGTEGPTLRLEAVLLTRDGVVAYAVRASGVNVYPLRTRLVAWSGRRYDAARDGVPRPLDDGPAGSITSLRLAGATLTWLHDGVPRSATLTRPGR